MFNMKSIFFISTLFFALQTQAQPIQQPVAYPPHHIKPHTSLVAPSGLSPSQISMAYGFSFVPYQGDGQTIAIIDAYDDPTIESDLGAFNSAFNLPDCTVANGCLTIAYASGSQPAQDANWNTETALDVEWAHAIAPKAKIMLVEATDSSFSALFAAVSYAVSHGATTISMSWGSSEFSTQKTYEAILKTYATAGVTMLVASGDSGHGLSYPASSLYVIAVGGTSLSIDATGNYLGESAWSGSSGGLSAYIGQTSAQASFAIPKNTGKKRGVPDVSLHADPNNGYSVYDSANGGWLVVGGTSAACPIWAALIALAKSGTHKKLTHVYNALYAQAKASYKYYFNDVTTGTNGVCGYYCTAQSGFDYVTGIGSPQTPYVINYLMYNAFDNKQII